MSYEDMHCPCGGTKWADTMLCDACVQFTKGRREWAVMNDTHEGLDNRRHAAIILITLARGRLREQARAAAPIPKPQPAKPSWPTSFSPPASPSFSLSSP